MSEKKIKTIYMIRQKSTGKYFSSEYSFTTQGKIFRRMFEVKDGLRLLFERLSRIHDKSQALSEILNDIELLEFTETTSKSLHFMMNEFE